MPCFLPLNVPASSGLRREEEGGKRIHKHPDADDKMTMVSISGPMTLALVVYSATFMRYSMAVTPQNYLLFACHLINEGSQLTQGYRYLSWHNWGGREKALASGELVLDKAKETVKEGVQKVEAAVGK